MKKIFIALALLWSMLLFSLQYTPKQLIIKTNQKLNTKSKRTASTELNDYLRPLKIKSLKAVTNKTDNKYYVITVENEIDWNDLNSKKTLFNGIESIQPNYLYKFNAVPNDPMLSNQQIDMVNLKQAWDLTTGSENVLVAVVDSGIAFDHPDLQTNIFYNTKEIPDNGIDDDKNGYIDDYRGWDFSDAPFLSEIALGDYIDQDNDPSDENWHGTHVTGIIAADSDNAEGIAGVCWNASILVIRAGFKTTTGQGYLQDDDVSAAIIYATDMGAEIINISWGDDNYSQIIADACQYAYDKGVVIVCAAGNSASLGVNYPAKLNTTICVGAVDPSNNLTGFSSFGPNLDVMAPGMNILSTYNPSSDDKYAYMPGTSMAAPFVSGAAALYLSQNPLASNDEVKAAICGSATDILPKGFDNTYGHGVLDVNALLLYSKKAEAKILNPSNMQSVSINIDEYNRPYFDIIGTAKADDFFRYSVTYTNKSNPQNHEWYDVDTNLKVPTFYKNQVENDKLARFYLPPNFTEGEYLIRLKVSDSNYTDYISEVIVNYDETPPSFYDNYFEVQKRYNAEKQNYYVQCVFDEPVFLELDIFDNFGNEHSVYSNFADSLQILKVPEYLPDGNIDIKIKAVNLAGLSYESVLLEDVANISHTTIETNGFEHLYAGKTKVFTTKTKDFNGNGIQEFIAMDFENTSVGTVGTYEFNGATLQKVHGFDDKFWPRDIGNSNADGSEILATKLGLVLLYESIPLTSQYPNIAVVDSSGVFDGVLANIDDDSEDELIFVRSLSTERVLTTYDRTDLGSIEAKYTFYNLTETSIRNTFAPTLIVDDLTNNGNQNLLAADTDGDVMVFEFLPDADPVLVFRTRLPVPNAYMLSSGDYTGNGFKDFVVGGYITNNTSPEKTFWYMAMYSYNPIGHSFYLADEIMFDQYQSNNSLLSIDIDGDNDDELICALSPNLYILDYDSVNGLKPIYTCKAMNNFKISGLAKTESQDFCLAFNKSYQDSSACFVLTKQQNFLGPKTVQNFNAVPKSKNSIKLSWKNLFPLPQSYKIVKKVNNTIIDTITVAGNLINYTDIEVSQSIEYEYAVAAYDGVNYPEFPLGQFSAFKTAIPEEKPVLANAPEMISANLLKLTFSMALDNNAGNIGHYKVNNGLNYPVSATLIDQQKSVLLKFKTNFIEADDYSINIAGIKGRTGVELDAFEQEFLYNPNTVLPKVISTEIIGNKQVEVKFSKQMNVQSLAKLENYSLVTPESDENNSILSISASEESCTVTFAANLRYSNQSYKIYIKNVVDANGNKLANDGDIASFGLTRITNLNFVEVVPNPLNLDTYNEFRFLNLPLNQSGMLYVYDISGDMVFKGNIPKLSSVNNVYTWNASNGVARKISSGTYFYVIKMGSKLKKGTLSIIR